MDKLKGYMVKTVKITPLFAKVTNFFKHTKNNPYWTKIPFLFSSNTIFLHFHLIFSFYVVIIFLLVLFVPLCKRKLSSEYYFLCSLLLTIKGY